MLHTVGLSYIGMLNTRGKCREQLRTYHSGPWFRVQFSFGSGVRTCSCLRVLSVQNAWYVV